MSLLNWVVWLILRINLNDDVTVNAKAVKRCTWKCKFSIEFLAITQIFEFKLEKN